MLRKLYFEEMWIGYDSSLIDNGGQPMKMHTEVTLLYNFFFLQKDHVFHRQRFLVAEPEASSVSNSTFTMNDMVEIDRFFDEMDEEKQTGDS